MTFGSLYELVIKIKKLLQKQEKSLLKIVRKLRNETDILLERKIKTVLILIAKPSVSVKAREDIPAGSRSATVRRALVTTTTIV